MRLLECLFSCCCTVKCHVAGLENQQERFPTAVAEDGVLVTQGFAEDVQECGGDAVSITVSPGTALVL